MKNFIKMKHKLLLIIAICFLGSVNAQKIKSIQSSKQVQNSKTVNIDAGELVDALNAVEKQTITKLTITGIIDARDFKIIRDNLPNLDKLDLSNASIAFYNGRLGTSSMKDDQDDIRYPPNTIPNHAFGGVSFQMSSRISSILLPFSITAIGNFSFEGCSFLKSIDLPPTVRLCKNISNC